MGQDTTAFGETAQSATRLSVFMFTDVVDSTKLKQPDCLGAAAYADLARRHDAIFRQIVSAVAGAEVLKDVGDGFMAIFATASDAVSAALRFQLTIHSGAEFSPASSSQPFRVRLGVHQGEVSVLDLDIGGKPKLVGPAADMTARIMSCALPGQILLSRPVFDSARQYIREHPSCGDGNACPKLEWQTHGYFRFKGVQDPQEIFEVGAVGSAPLQRPPNAEKAKYVGSPAEEEMGKWRPAVGQDIPRRDHWRLERKIGEGGFGEVWLASHQKTKEWRVFKFCFSSDRLRSFQRELTLFRLLRDALGDRKDIARVFDVSLESPPFMLESQYEAGGNLLDWATKHGGIATLALAERIELLAQIADAVAAAHSVGILHKDLKPTNIFVREIYGKPEPILADFGIGVLADRTQLKALAITEAGFTQMTENDSSRTGTRMYAPPELLSDKPYTVRGDIYALGVMLYQFVVGDLTLPLASGWERQIHDDLLREEIAACVDGDPNRRPASATEVAARLRGLETKRAERQRQMERDAAIRARARRTRLATATSIVLAALLLTGGLTARYYIQRLAAANSEISREKDLAIRQRTEADHQRDLAERELSDAYVERGIFEWDKNDPAVACLYFVRALNIDVQLGDKNRQLMERIRIATSLDASPRPLDVPTPKVQSDCAGPFFVPTLTYSFAAQNHANHLF